MAGLGTALKPAWEPIVVARKPLAGTVAANVQRFGTGALNIDGCRVGLNPGYSYDADHNGTTFHGEQGKRIKQSASKKGAERIESNQGRWPANVVLSHADGCRQRGTSMVRGDQRDTGGGKRPGGFADIGADRGDGQPNASVYGNETIEVWDCVHDCPVRLLDEQSGDAGAAAPVRGSEPSPITDGIYGDRARIPGAFHADQGGASRFFYCAKASTAERNAGLANLPKRQAYAHNIDGRDLTKPTNAMGAGERARVERGEPGIRPARNPHPTVKPIDLMRWLVRLVTPPGGTVLDPFVGSGTTGAATILEGFDFIGIEREPEYAEIARQRMTFWADHPTDLPIEKALESERRRQKMQDAGQDVLF